MDILLVNKLAEKKIFNYSDFTLPTVPVNSKYFNEAATTFLKTGFYTKAPKYSPEYISFWKEERRRCLEGYTVGGQTITGKHYFYLNYCPMSVVKQNNNYSGVKVKGFPELWEIDYAWFWYTHVSRLLGKHRVCLKTRRSGFSYKEAAESVYNYTFIPNSKSYIYASQDVYLKGDKIIDKVVDIMSHLNEHTAFAKKRQKVDSRTSMQWRASYIETLPTGEKVEKGYMSEIIGQVVDNPNKTRGGSAEKITFEEAGSFKHLIKAWIMARPQVEEGNVVTGQMTAFGTGGEENEEIAGLTELFYKPDLYGVLPLYNIWDIGQQEKMCGFFVPVYKAVAGYFDEFGIINEQAAKAKFDNEREKLKEGADNARDRSIAEKPYTPREALYRDTGSNFPVKLIQAQIELVKNTKGINYNIEHGKLERTREGVTFYEEDVEPFFTFPIPKGTKTEGCISIVEHPDREVFENKYIITIDPFATDNDTESTSVGAVYVIKRASDALSYDKIVAWYVARPSLMQTFHHNIFMLSDYYNAKIMSEIQGGGQGIIDYANTNHLTHRLMSVDVLINNKEIRGTVRNKSYFVNITKYNKYLYIDYLSDWLQEPLGIDSVGNSLLRLHTIYDLGLLTEIEQYVSSSGNYDRISAMALGVATLKGMQNIEIEESEKLKTDDFFSKYEKSMKQYKLTNPYANN